MLIHWIWLATRPHISDMVKVELVQQFGDAEGPLSETVKLNKRFSA